VGTFTAGQVLNIVIASEVLFEECHELLVDAILFTFVVVGAE
jgi:hypothetical protein